MKFGRSYWAIPVLAILSMPTATLSGFLEDPEPTVTSSSVSLASAPDPIAVYISPPGVEGPPDLAGVTIESFNGLHGCPSGANPTVPAGTVLAVGTLSAQSLSLGCMGAATTSATAMPHTDPTGADYPSADRTAAAWVPGANHASPGVITLNQPVNYLGVYWIWGNSGDRFRLRSGGSTVLEFSTVDLSNLLPTGGTVNAIGGGTFLQNHYLGGRKGFGTPPNAMNIEPFVYLHFVAPPGTTFDEVWLSQNQLEFDNLATASLSATFDPTGLVGVPLNSYAITYNSQGGSSVAAGLYTQNSTVTLAAAPTRAGYAFKGWFTAASGGTALGATYAPPGTGAITLHAQWAPIVTFDANGGSGSSVTQSATGNTALTTNTYTRAGFTFSGWNTTISGTGSSYADGATFTFTTPTTLYAQWTAIPAAGGNQLPLVTLPVATTPPTTTPTPTTTPRPSPSTTAPPTTTTPTTVPAPVPDTFGVLPDLRPGESTVIENQLPTQVEVFLDDTNTLVMRGQDFELNLAGDCAQGCTVVSDAAGRETIELREDGNALVNGFGFMPGTPVHIWMFSEPTYLGSLLVADDGTFQGSVFLAGIAPGEHTLQVNGTSFDGNDRSANLGVIVTANTDPTPPLPATGTNRSNDLVLVALGLVLAGLLATTRRRV